MLYTFRPKPEHYSDYSYFDFENKSICDALIKAGEALMPKPATIGDGVGVIDTDYRPSKTAWFLPSQIPNAMQMVDAALWECSQYHATDYTGMSEKIQFTRYDGPGDKYDWHTDQNPGNNRKLSFVWMLSDVNEYWGGRLEILTQRKPSQVFMPKGRIVFFDSKTLHRVTPVQWGTRYTLVGWIS